MFENGWIANPTNAAWCISEGTGFGKGTGRGIVAGFSYTVVENKVVEPGVKRLTDFKLSLKVKNNEYNLNIKVDPYWSNQPYVVPQKLTYTPDPYFHNQPYRD